MLETKIQELTQAIEQLSKLIVDVATAYDQRQDTQQIATKPTQAPTPVPTETPTKAPEQQSIDMQSESKALPDREELKTLAAEKVRDKPENKDKVFAKLDELKAKKVKDLKDDQLQAFAQFLESL